MTSASTSTPDHRGNTGNLQKSHFQQTVCLADWWLVRAENDVQGRRLAVAGLTDRGKQAIRVFTSAPILKRYDDFTIETTDGICVILNGFINKARTLENRFPSDPLQLLGCGNRRNGRSYRMLTTLIMVFNYFVFGFPPCWKEYDEIFVAKEPLSKEISRDNHLEQLSQQLGSKGAQPHVDSHEKDYKSQGKTEAKGRQKSKKTKSLTVPELPKNEMKSLSDLRYGGSIKVQAVIDKHACYSQIRDSGGTLSACHLNNKRTKKAADNLGKMDCDKKTKTNFDWGMSSSEKVLNHNEVRVTTCSASSLKMKQTNNQRSAGISDGEKIRLNSISSIGSGKIEELIVDREPGSTNNLNYEDKGIREIKTRSKILKEKNKATELPCTPAASTKSRRAPAASTKSRRTPAAVDNQRGTVITGKNILLEKSKTLDMDTRRKLAPVSKETPESGKEKVRSVSPQSFSFNRSRSGRLLMPTMEFWRNQRAIYNVDRTITGIEEGMHPQQLRNEGGPTPHRKRK